MTASRDERQPDGLVDEATAATIEGLRQEIDGLRASARLRALIEQAKGILVAREGISLEEAFGRLRRMSQENNVRLVEVAATIVGVAAPNDDSTDLLAGAVLRAHLPASVAPSITWRSLQEDPDVRRGILSALLDSVVGAPAEGDLSARLLFDLLAPFGPAGLTLYRTGVDGSLRMVGSAKVPGDLASAWRHIPLSFDIPISRAVLDRRSYFWADWESQLAQFPAVARMRSEFAASAAVVVFDEEEVVGLVAIMWDREKQFDTVSQRSIERAVNRVTPLLIRHAVESDPDLGWMQALLSLHLDPWLLLDAVGSGDGARQHLVVQDSSEDIAEATDWLGRRLLEIWPALATDGTWDALSRLVRTGGYWSTTISAPGAGPWGTPGARLRAVRVGSRVVVVWRRPGR